MRKTFCLGVKFSILALVASAGAAMAGQRDMSAVPAPETVVSMDAVFPRAGNAGAPTPYRASRVVVGPSGRIFVYDAGNGRILRLGPDGRFQMSFGNAGPMEERLDVSPASGSLLAVGADECVYATVPASRFVWVYSPDGRFLRKVSLPFTVIVGLAVAPDGSILVSPLTQRVTSTVYRFSPEGRLVSSFGSRLVEANGMAAFQVNAGVLATGRDGSVFQASSGWPIVRKFAPDGSLLWEATFDIPAALRQIMPSDPTLENVRAHPGDELTINTVGFGIVATRDGGCVVLTNGFGVIRVGPMGRVQSARTIAVDPLWDSRFFSSVALAADERSLLLLDGTGSRVFIVPENDTARLLGESPIGRVDRITGFTGLTGSCDLTGRI